MPGKMTLIKARILAFDDGKIVLYFIYVVLTLQALYFLRILLCNVQLIYKASRARQALHFKVKSIPLTKRTVQSVKLYVPLTVRNVLNNLKHRISEYVSRNINDNVIGGLLVNSLLYFGDWAFARTAHFIVFFSSIKPIVYNGL